MNFASYDAFRTGLQWLIEGQEMSGTFSVNTLDLIIGLAEARVHNGDDLTPGLRASSMLADLSETVTANVAELPEDLLQLHEVYFSGESPLEIVPLDRVRRLLDAGTAGSTVRYAAQKGDSLIFWPSASGTVLGSYFAKPEALATITWGDATTFARYPELYVYASLFEAALFLGILDKMPMWESRYRQLADGANAAERARVYGGGTLRVRTR